MKVVLRAASIDVRENVSSVKRNTGIVRIREFLEGRGIFFPDSGQLFLYQSDRIGIVVTEEFGQSHRGRTHLSFNKLGFHPVASDDFFDRRAEAEKRIRSPSQETLSKPNAVWANLAANSI